MAKSIEYLHFDALRTPLEGTNLIEASAGTGKTYSIAILVLRLVLEQKLPVTEILMVTFTKAAVAELEERVRHFIRIAQKGSQGAAIEDDNIKQLLREAQAREGKEEVAKRLRLAVLLLDELSVKTIHSFCQATLDEFAFETAQPFGATVLSDTTAMLDEEMARFWRSNITTLQPELLALLWSDGMMGSLKTIVREHLSGKQYYGFDAAGDYDCPEEVQDEWLKSYTEMHAVARAPWEELISDVAARTETLRAACLGNTYAKKDLPELLAHPEKFLLDIESKKTKGYIQKLFPELLERINACRAAEAEPEAYLATIHQRIKCLAIRQMCESITRVKQQRNVITYDDILTNLHAAISSDNKDRLAEGLRKRYKAVFVDEFQDTDRQQYEIFQAVFGQETIVCFIGDPKQSIYGWRKADMATYFTARQTVARCYSMNHNFRSSAALIEAMNRFFIPVDGFDTFRYGGDSNAIHYIPVQCPEGTDKGILQGGVASSAPICIYTCKNKQEIIDGVAAQVANLLTDPSYKIKSAKGERRITPSDLGILVRTSGEGRNLRAALASLGIPAVMMDDARVLQAEEAQMILHLLQAIATPDRSAISRALLSQITTITRQDIAYLDDEAILQRFARYRTRWNTDGVYAAVMDFLNEFAVPQILLAEGKTGGERILTNLYQLAELVHQVQMRKGLSVVETIAWLKRGIEGAATEGDEYEQRIESDEEAVQIITIHKSKGLEYNIVFAPHMDLLPKDDVPMFSFRDAETGNYISVEKEKLTTEMRQQYMAQQEQENARLLYVAVTRAVYKCYLFHSKAAYYRGSTLHQVVNELASAESHLICFEQALPTTPNVKYRKAATGSKQEPRTLNIKLHQPEWSKLSYTRLAAKGEHGKRQDPIELTDDYDRFVFKELFRGKKAGDMLHYILERISFTDESKWEEIITDAVATYNPAQQEKYVGGLLQLLRQVVYCPIQVGNETVSLSAVGWKQRIAEFEFDFPVNLFTAETLQELSDEDATFRIKQGDGIGLEGFMNGKIDLFFCHERKYYILDWKSNYLGDSLECYHPDALKEAMTESNYHLQYLIYCVAVKKYLQSRLPDFSYERDFGGVAYLFLRGVRKEGVYGVFICKPRLEKVKAIERLFDAKDSSTSQGISIGDTFVAGINTAPPAEA